MTEFHTSRQAVVAGLVMSTVRVLTASISTAVVNGFNPRWRHTVRGRHDHLLSSVATPGAHKLNLSQPVRGPVPHRPLADGAHGAASTVFTARDQQPPLLYLLDRKRAVVGRDAIDRRPCAAAPVDTDAGAGDGLMSADVMTLFNVVMCVCACGCIHDSDQCV
jgi:hypothetical protein